MPFLILTNINGPNLLYRKQKTGRNSELMKKPLTRRSFLQGAGMASAATRAAPVFGSRLRCTQTGPSPPDRPYEAGHSTSEPLGSPRRREVTGLPSIGGVSDRTYPWTVRHPELRLRARQNDLPRGMDGIVVQAIQLRKLDDSAHSLRRENLEIWTSTDNYQYRNKRALKFSKFTPSAPDDLWKSQRG